MAPMQLDLLSVPRALPEGMRYEPEIFSAKAESDIIEQVRGLNLREFEFQGYRGKRRVISFGMHYDFTDSRLEQTEDMPAFLLPLRDLAARFAGLEPVQLPHVLITEYSPGAGIGWHRDRPVFDDVIGLSLASSCLFRLRRKTGTKWERVTLDVEPRSAYLLRGPSRHLWEHSIPASERLRYSITFRSLRSAG
jgi:alkylated DNA repair dioxygenase AlkB